MGLLRPGQPLMTVRPFRSPHHSVSDAGLVGGGSVPQPGEISLAHKGVLFLDELPEFNRKPLEVLRQPLEEGRVTISRALRSTTFPADFILVAAMNPCPCGYRSDPRRPCTCSPPQVEKYLSKISGPLLDRIDLQIEVPSLPVDDLPARRGGAGDGEPSAVVRERVAQAALRQTSRQGKTNRLLQTREIERWCALDPPSEALLKQAFARLSLSARAYHRILRVARTISCCRERAFGESRRGGDKLSASRPRLNAQSTLYCQSTKYSNE